MKNAILPCFLFMFSVAIAQEDDLLKELDKQAPKVTNLVTATFKSTRVINGQSVESIAAKHMDFRISHRFGAVNKGFNELWGLDDSRIRIAFEYGVTDKLMVGLGRSSWQKTYDYFAKYRLLRQSDKMPLSVSVFANMATNTTPSSPIMTFTNNSQRQSYCMQALVARKINESASIQISPTYLHRNKVEITGDPNSLVALGLGGRFKVSKRTSFNAEYFLTMNSRPTSFTNPLQIGFDIETGGHVFQLHFSNSRGMVENQFIGSTTGSWGKGDIFYGFNISRIFSFDKQAKGIIK